MLLNQYILFYLVFLVFLVYHCLLILVFQILVYRLLIQVFHLYHLVFLILVFHLLNLVFLILVFNNNLEQIQQRETMERYRQLMAADQEIIALRQSVRRAAESKLAHGIIDVNDLVREMNSENAARVQQSVHEIEMLKEAYNLKFTTNEQ